MLLRNYALRVVRSDCNPAAQTVNALADLEEDIGEALPYLNTVLKGCQYDHEEKILVVKRDGHLITFRPRQIALTKLEDEDETRSVLEELQGIINAAYAGRENIEPTYASRPSLRPLDVFKFLPGTNCRECGEPTCLAFAVKLAAGEVEGKQCPLLSAPEYKEKNQKLTSLLGQGRVQTRLVNHGATLR